MLSQRQNAQVINSVLLAALNYGEIYFLMGAGTPGE
jgi:hypothetical protein